MLMGIFKSKWEVEVDNSLFSFIEIEQFRNFKISTIWNYSLMWFLLLLQTVLYGVDVYTCIKLLAFNTWGSEIQPYISFKISKWLFAACIICSVVLWIFEAIRGIRVFRTGNISLTYTNPFARKLRSIKSYNCFCVLNEINPTDGFEKMAFYTYFTLHDAKKLILADSPRQVINSLTLWSVLKVDTDFWETLKQISVTNRNMALVLYAMLVSLAIWIFFMIQLFFAIAFTIPVLYNVLHKQGFQSLKQFVCIKVDKTVKKLARKYQKESLRKNYNDFKLESTNSFENILEKPSIPKLKTIPSNLSLLENKSQSTFTNLSNASSFESIADMKPIRPYSQLDRSYSKEKFQESSVNLVAHALHSQNYTIDPNPFRNMIERPSQIHQRSSNPNILKRSDEDDDLVSSVYDYQMPNDSTLSLTEGGQFPEREVFIPDLVGMIPSTPSEREDFVKDHKDNTELKNYSIHDTENEDFDDDLLLTGEPKANRKHVRPSLILRARKLEIEDYSSYGILGKNDDIV